MKIKGKIFGAGAGWLFAGLPGAIIGGLLGHFLDSIPISDKTKEIEMLKEMAFWAAKVSMIDDRFMFSKREYVENNIMKSSKITPDQKINFMKSFDRYLENKNIKMISIRSNVLKEKRYKYFRELYNLASIGGLTNGKRAYLKNIVGKFRLSDSEFIRIDEEFLEKLDSYNEEVKWALEMLRLPIIFTLEDVKRQNSMLKNDFNNSNNSDYRYRLKEIDEAFITLNNYLKEV